jgi:hypothetical protein
MNNDSSSTIRLNTIIVYSKVADNLVFDYEILGLDTGFNDHLI